MKSIQQINSIEKMQMRFYQTAIIVLYVCYFLIFFGIYQINPLYVRALSLFIHLFICGFLLWRFNPFKPHHELKHIDIQIIFASAIILLTNVIATEVSIYIQNPFQYFISNVKTKILP